LRDAVIAASNDGDDSQIVFAPSITGTISLTNGDLGIANGTDTGKNLTITGPGAAALTVTNSTISNNTTATNAKGGGVFMYQSGNMTVTNSTVTGNTATGNGDGGGVFFYRSDDMTVTNSTVTGNDGNDGGGIKFYKSGNGTVTGSTISNNTSTTGGGLKFYNSTSLTVTNSTITGNHAVTGAGGGIDFYQGGNAPDPSASLTITGSTISGNDAARNGGGIQFYDRGSARNSTVTTLTILDSTISGNTTTRSGGGLYFYGNTATIANSTIAGNSAQNDGGGIAAFAGNVSLLQSTISGNTAGPDAVDFGDGLYLRGPGAAVKSLADPAAKDAKPARDDTEAKGGKSTKPPKPARVSSDSVGTLSIGTVNLVGTIVSGNGTGDIETQSTATVNSMNSLWGTKSAGITINDQGGTINSSTPGLAALANNGGPTQTMALLAGSLALDAGPTTVPTFSGNQFDQRGAGFPRVVNGRVDIGSYERALVVRFTG